MKLKDIYQKGIKVGIRHEMRSKKDLDFFLNQRKKEFKALKPEDQEYYDKERLTNPYSDSRIFYGDEKTEVKTVMVGIDITGEELLLADRLKERGKKIDAVLSHHPTGHTSNFKDVMWLQTDLFHSLGIPINVAESLFKSRTDIVDRRRLPRNYQRFNDFAKLLDIPFLAMHTPADNCVNHYLTKKIKKEAPETVSELINLLEKEPEYRAAKGDGMGPRIISGSPTNRLGEVLVKMTGGTEGPKEIIEKLATSTQVGTIVGMHMSEEMLAEARKHHLNVIIAGHMASDTLGMNLLLDGIFQNEKVNFIECSGFRRIKRRKK